MSRNNCEVMANLGSTLGLDPEATLRWVREQRDILMERVAKSKKEAEAKENSIESRQENGDEEERVRRPLYNEKQLLKMCPALANHPDSVRCWFHRFMMKEKKQRAEKRAATANGSGGTSAKKDRTVRRFHYSKMNVSSDDEGSQEE